MQFLEYKENIFKSLKGEDYLAGYYTIIDTYHLQTEQSFKWFKQVMIDWQESQRE